MAVFACHDLHLAKKALAIAVLAIERQPPSSRRRTKPIKVLLDD